MSADTTDQPAPAPEDGRRTRLLRADPESLRAKRLVAHLDSGALTDRFRMLRTQVLQRLAQANGTTLAITSPSVGAGKTMIAANLACSIAGFAHHTVLLVDLDLRRPGVHAMFGIEPAVGIRDCLLQGTPLADCLVNPGIEGLVLLPAGAPVAESSELLSSARMAEIAQELKTRYPDRIVIYDLAPILVTDDALVSLQHADGCLVVIEHGGTRKDEIERAARLLEGVNVIGTVLNKARGAPAKGAYV